MRARVLGLAEPQVAPLLVVACASNCAWRPPVSMHSLLWVHVRSVVEAVDPPNCIGEKWRRMSDVSRKRKCARGVGTTRELPCLRAYACLVGTTNALHPIACAHPDTLSFMMSASYCCQEKVSRACLSVMLKCNVCWPNGSY